MDAINNALNSIFPNVKPLGLDKETGKIITMMSNFEDRVIDKNLFEDVRTKVSKSNFQIKYTIA